MLNNLQILFLFNNSAKQNPTVMHVPAMICLHLRVMSTHILETKGYAGEQKLAILI